MNDLTHLSLFTGIGGIDLAAEWAGFRTIGQVEQNKYALRILRNRFGRRISRWSDIRDISASDFKRRTGIDSPTLISGGFPCQPFSYAGKRRGTADDRYLWPEMFRIVRELRPSWVIGENVAGIVSMELEPCCSDLEGEGYTVRAFLIPACGVGAWHRRERVFIVASNTGYMSRGSECQLQKEIPQEPIAGSTGQLLSKDVAHSDRERLEGKRSYLSEEGGQDEGGSVGLCYRNGGKQWEIEPAVGRVAHGVPHRVDRLRCLGNAVVPQQVYPILAGITQIEETKMIAQNSEVRE